MKKKSKNRLRRPIFNDWGYTLLEVLIATTILGVVVIPLVVLLGSLLVNYSTSDLLTATNLARAEMESTLHNRDFNNEEKQMKLNNISWKIEKRLLENEGLLSIKINVSRAKEEKLLASVYTEKFLGTEAKK